MATAILDTRAITDWASFHDACQAAFGFPEFYGRNVNAFIDCLNYVDEGDGMSRFHLAPGETLTIEVLEADEFATRAPDQALAILAWTGFVNQNAIADGKPPRLLLLAR